MIRASHQIRKNCAPLVCAILVFALLMLFVVPRAPAMAPTADDAGMSGSPVALTLEFHNDTLQRIGWSFALRGPFGELPEARRATFFSNGPNSISVVVEDGVPRVRPGGSLDTQGGLLLSRHGERALVLGDLTLQVDAEGRWLVISRLGSPNERLNAFALPDVSMDVTPGGDLRMVGALTIHRDLANALNDSNLTGVLIGTVRLDGPVRAAERKSGISDRGDLDDGEPAPALAATSGPDVIVGDLHDVQSYGNIGFGDIWAFSIGTTSCNAGDTPLSWYGQTNQHPVIAQNLYRLKDGRFEQIGMSWLKHGFLAVTGNSCLLGCTAPPGGGNQLGVGCSDPYSASLNGQQSNLGPRSQVNAFTGFFPYPFSAPPATHLIHRRLQAREADIDPALNAGALYFVEGHYVTADDAAAGNHNNNASYRRASITDTGTDFVLNLTSVTKRRNPAIRAWNDFDPSVVETDIQVPGEGLFMVAAKVTDLGNGFWRYEYAIQNLNSDRSASQFRVPVDVGATVLNPGFHDVDYHSGELLSGTDWSMFMGNGFYYWQTDSFFTNQNANALRWGSLYNFRIDVDVPPAMLPATLELYKPGSPSEVSGLTLVPATPPPACGNGMVEAGEACDPPDNVHCDAGCQPIINDPLRGGLLWDEWWTVNGSPPPEGDHPLYPPAGQQTGIATFRCKECHGWDYKGADGAYGGGAHFTGIPGVFGTTKTSAEMFALIRNSTPPHGHGFATLGLSDQDVRDLVQFVEELAIDTDQYVDGTGEFLGNEASGQLLYDSGGIVACSACHGGDGQSINFGTALNPEWVGTVADDNPWEFLHKIRFGNPGTGMPSWLAGGGTDQEAADIGRYAQLVLPAVCTTDAHCDDGKYCNGAESCLTGVCQPGVVPCPNQPCDDLNDVCGVADAHRGGLLYDRWWSVLELNAPIGTHPLYPHGGPQSGSATFRCVECHGWDYKGADGVYATGPHATGIGGVFGSSMTAGQMFTLLRDGGPVGHEFGAFGLSDNDIWDLVAFVQDLAIDTDTYISAGGAFLGDPVQGQVHYDSGGSPACGVCHGPDGTDLNFGTAGDPEWVGTVAVYDPWKLLHKIRIGNAGSPMPSWLLDGGDDQGAADLGRYAQVSMPVDCLNATHCDDDLFCNGAELCAAGFCEVGNDPCPNGICDESITSCLSGLCPPPTTWVAGSRYLGITAPEGVASMALAVSGQAMDSAVACVESFVQSDGTLGPTAFFQSSAAWGNIVVRGLSVVPAAGYRVRSDCGTPGSPDLSLAADVSTLRWADVDGNDFVNFIDVLLMIKVFQGDVSIATLAEADIEPCTPNGLVNFLDVQRGVLAFQGQSFSMVCAGPCP